MNQSIVRTRITCDIAWLTSPLQTVNKIIVSVIVSMLLSRGPEDLLWWRWKYSCANQPQTTKEGPCTVSELIHCMIWISDWLLIGKMTCHGLTLNTLSFPTYNVRQAMKYEAEEKSACPSSLSGCPVLLLIPGTVVTWKEEKKRKSVCLNVMLK